MQIHSESFWREEPSLESRHSIELLLLSSSSLILLGFGYINTAESLNVINYCKKTSMFKNIFTRKANIKQQTKDLEIAKQKMSESLETSMEVIKDDINNTREFFEKMKNNGIRKFDNLLTVSLQSSVANADIMLLTAKIRTSTQRFEKVLFARMLAMIAIEYLNDIDSYLGFNLIGELNSNGYKDLVPLIKEINKEFGGIRKKHGPLLTSIRNNISAHKTKDALSLVHYIFNIDPEEIFNLGLEIISTNTKLTNATTDIYYKMIDEARDRKKSSR